MPAKKDQITVRCFPEQRELLSQIGVGNVSEGFQALIERHKILMRHHRPDYVFTEAELLAITGATKSWGWCTEPIHLQNHLAIELEDYPYFEPQEAGQWDVDWKRLAGKVSRLSSIQAYSLLENLQLWFSAGGNESIGKFVLPKPE